MNKNISIFLIGFERKGPELLLKFPSYPILKAVGMKKTIMSNNRKGLENTRNIWHI